MPSTDALPQRVLVSYAAPDAFAPTTRLLFSRLGYVIIDADTYAETSDLDERPDAFVVDDRLLADVPDDGGPSIPIVALAGRTGVTGADPRVMGAVPRPAGLHDLYRVLQQVLEDRPRSSPRVPVHLPVRCWVEESGAWRGSILMLSENGCLLRSPESLLLGSKLNLRFELPRHGEIELLAEVAYQLPPDLGLIFSSTQASVRQALVAAVSEALAAL